MNMWPMLFIFTVICVSLRITYLLFSREPFILYKELLTLLFILYILMLYYIVTVTDPIQEITEVGFNLIPFKEIFRYEVHSTLFLKNVVGNILLFVPFGFFSALYLRKHRFIPVTIVTFITSISVEATQRMIGRVFDVDDVILNVVGGFIGYILYVLMDKLGKKMPNWARSNAFRDLLAIILSLIVLAYLLRFYIPMIEAK